MRCAPICNPSFFIMNFVWFILQYLKYLWFFFTSSFHTLFFLASSFALSSSLFLAFFTSYQPFFFCLHINLLFYSSFLHSFLSSFLQCLQDMLAMPTVKGRKSPSERFAGADDTYTIEALMQNGWALQSGTRVHGLLCCFKLLHTKSCNFMLCHLRLYFVIKRHHTLHQTTLHGTAFHCTTPHCTTLHYTALHHIALHYATLHHTTLHYTTLHYTTLYATLHYTTLRYTTLHYATLHYTTLHYPILQLIPTLDLNSNTYSLFLNLLSCTKFIYFFSFHLNLFFYFRNCSLSWIELC